MIMMVTVFLHLTVRSIRGTRIQKKPIDGDSRWKRRKFRTRKFPFEIKSEEI
jgi:hypothetical protein